MSLTMFHNRKTVRTITIIISAILVIALILPMIGQLFAVIFS